MTHHDAVKNLARLAIILRACQEISETPGLPPVASFELACLLKAGGELARHMENHANGLNFARIVEELDQAAKLRQAEAQTERVQ